MSTLPTLKVKLPASELLSLASRALGALQAHQYQLHEKFEAEEKEDERAEAMECLTDTSLVYSVIDPQSYYSARKKMFGQDAADVPKGLDSPSKRFDALLNLGSVGAGKAQFVIPQAVSLFLEQREKEKSAGSEEGKREKAVLDLLLFLAENRDRASLFEREE